MPLRRVHSLLAGLLLASCALSAAAQPTGFTPRELEGVGVDERLENTLPRDLVLRDEHGEPVALGAFFDGERPVLLNLAYHHCALMCNLVVDGLAKTMQEMAWTPGAEFDVLTVSFNPAETPELARAQKERYLATLGKPDAAAGWHFLTGEAEALRRLTDAVGFRYTWLEERQEFAHPAVLIFLSGDGVVTRYLYGMNLPPRDVRQALVEASAGRVGSPLDQILLYCFGYDPAANAYVLEARLLMKIGGALTVVLLAGGLFFFWARERRRHVALAA